MANNNDWDEALCHLNPYRRGGADVRPLVALLEEGQAVPPNIAKRLGALLNPDDTSRLFGYGLVVKKYQKFQARKVVAKAIKEQEAYQRIKDHYSASEKLESAIQLVIEEQSYYKRAKLMEIWSEHQARERVEQQILAKGQSTTLKKRRGPGSS